MIIPEGVESIGDWAFSGCSNLSKVTIPDSVINIGEKAFIYCDNLTIYGKPGSCAEEYADENDIPFVALFTVDFDIDMGQTDFTYTKEKTEGAVIKCSGDANKLRNTYVDDKPVSKDNYIVESESGSTIITFTKDFMDKLSDGEHIFKLEYEDGQEIEVSITVTTPAVGGIIGDVNGNTKINTIDALTVLKYVATLIDLNDNAKKMADVNGDDKINTSDALDILKKVAGLIDHFKTES